LTSSISQPVQQTTSLDTDIEIVYQDESLLVVNKPAGMLSVPGRGPEKQDCLISRVQQRFPNARTVHRLDMATSGLIIIALSHDSQRALSKLFELRQVDKTYQAIVYGLVEQTSGKVDLPLICDWPNRPRQKVCHESGKPSQTEYRVISQDKDKQYTRISLHPITGRSHQLRVHMQALGHPILGDYFYAEDEALAASERLCLHAQKLSFIHPFTKEKVHLNSEPSF
jgi:tRNA pseudouridine32 synthase / 23S rRNA pseudouridine746 synthase